MTNSFKVSDEKTFWIYFASWRGRGSFQAGLFRSLRVYLPGLRSRVTGDRGTFADDCLVRDIRDGSGTANDWGTARGPGRERGTSDHASCPEEAANLLCRLRLGRFGVRLVGAGSSKCETLCLRVCAGGDSLRLLAGLAGVGTRPLRVA